MYFIKHIFMFDVHTQTLMHICVSDYVVFVLLKSDLMLKLLIQHKFTKLTFMVITRLQRQKNILL